MPRLFKAANIHSAAAVLDKFFINSSLQGIDLSRAFRTLQFQFTHIPAAQTAIAKTLINSTIECLDLTSAFRALCLYSTEIAINFCESGILINLYIPLQKTACIFVSSVSSWIQ